MGFKPGFGLRRFLDDTSQTIQKMKELKGQMDEIETEFYIERACIKAKIEKMIGIEATA